MEKSLPPIPVKRYFNIGEVSELCDVKPHVLRYWEQEFAQLKPMKRRGNRRYYQHHEVLMVRRIRDLLYDQGFTISGARNKLHEIIQAERDKRKTAQSTLSGSMQPPVDGGLDDTMDSDLGDDAATEELNDADMEHIFDAAEDVLPVRQLRRELYEIRQLLAA